jgi:phosphoglycolate phosphatase
MPFPVFEAPLPSAVVFDLDGTLVDSAPDLLPATNHALALIDRAPVSLETLRSLVGGGLRQMIRLGAEASGGPVEEADLDRLLGAGMVHYADHISDNTTIYDGVIENLESLAAANVPMAVCTNKTAHYARRLISDLRLTPYFKAILGGDSLAVRKPDGNHIRAAIRAAGAHSSGAVMVGDSITDVDGARNAGVPVVLVSFGYTVTPARELGADAVIDHFDELSNALASLKN